MTTTSTSTTPEGLVGPRGNVDLITATTQRPGRHEGAASTRPHGWRLLANRGNYAWSKAQMGWPIVATLEHFFLFFLFGF